jgi:hypothetical protein
MAIPQFTAGQVLTAAELNAMVDAINAGGAVKVATFTSSGTWTVPTGVTYAVAYILAGGGGTGLNTTAGNGGTSSVAFAAGTVSATGGTKGGIANTTGALYHAVGVVNSGQGGLTSGDNATSADTALQYRAQDGALITAGGVVSPAASITVTVGAGGTAGTSGIAGGTGYVYIEYQGG